MRCPDCNRDFPIKPEVIVEKEPCKCGLTETARNLRIYALVAIAALLCSLGACLSDHYWTTKQVELMRERYEVRDKKNSSLQNIEKLGLPFDVTPKK